MTFKVKGFSTVRILSSDVSRSREWYRRLFDLDPVEDLKDLVAFQIGKTRLDIAQADSLSPSSVGGSVGYWHVDNLESLIAKANALGGEVYRGPLRVEEIKRTIAQIKDPIGNVIGFEADF